MALFGKKKGASPASPAEPVSPSQSAGTSNTSALDALGFEAATPQSNATPVASPFDDLVAAPQASTDTPSAFEFPESGADVPTEVTTQIPDGTGGALDLDDIFASAPTDQNSIASNPTASATETDDPFAVGPVASASLPVRSAVQTPVAAAAPVVDTAHVVVDTAPEPGTIVRAAPKRKSSLLPIGAALGALALAGLGANYLLNSGASDEDETQMPVATTTRSNRPAIVPAAGAPTPNSVAASPATSTRPQVAPGANTASPALSTTTTRTTTARSASTTSSNVSTTPLGASTTSGAPTTNRVTTLNPMVAAQLKTLWQQGADAKRRGDYANARRAWTLALQVRPGHPGFQESIDKLPR